MIIGKFIIWFLAFLFFAVAIGVVTLIIAKVIKTLLKMFSDDNVDKK